MTGPDLDAFISEEVADYADEGVREGTWPRCTALDCARAALATVVDWERQAATADRQRLWAALTPDSERVGWLWVKLAPPSLAPEAPGSARAFLCQMTVARACRHRGYGRAMLAALEARLLSDGIAELHLNVCEANVAAVCLYTAAGFETADRYPTMRKMRKRLGAGPGTALPNARPAALTVPVG